MVIRMIRNFVGTMVPVLLGVYLAIVAGNCNESRQSLRNLSILMEQLQSEIDANRADIQRSYEYHLELRDSVDAVYQRYTMEELQTMDARPVFSSWRGTRVGSMRRGIYMVGINGGVLSSLSTQKLGQINDLYNSMNNYERLGRIYLERGVNMTSNTTALDGLLFVSFFMNDIIAQESRLLDQMASLGNI